MFNFDVHPLKVWRISLHGELLHFLVPALILFLLCALYYAISRRSVQGLRTFIFPSGIFAHASCRMDMMMNLLSMALWHPLVSIVTSTFVGINVNRALNSYLGHDTPLMQSSALILVVQTLTWLASIQLGFYVMHRVSHTNPLLWRIHRIHHSAEALNFMTAGRVHPLEPLLFQIPIALTSGVMLGILLHVTGVPMSPALPVAQAIMLVVRGTANSIHHSHFDQSFGRLDHVFVSARMHQLHHSAELRHRDKNFGGFLSIYDWIFGTLYIPAPDEEFRVGLNEDELGASNPHQRLLDCYVEPFLPVWRAPRQKLENTGAGARTAPIDTQPPHFRRDSVAGL